MPLIAYYFRSYNTNYIYQKPFHKQKEPSLLRATQFKTRIEENVQKGIHHQVYDSCTGEMKAVGTTSYIKRENIPAPCSKCEYPS
jgi:hypothetical protein